jgi:hypothetical protein
MINIDTITTFLEKKEEIYQYCKKYLDEHKYPSKYFHWKIKTDSIVITYYYDEKCNHGDIYTKRKYLVVPMKKFLEQ